MAVTVTFNIPKYQWLNGEIVCTGSLNLGVYATGGLALTKQQLGMDKIDFLTLISQSGHMLSYNKTTEMLTAYEAAGVEVTNAEDLSAFDFPFQAQGIG